MAIHTAERKTIVETWPALPFSEWQNTCDTFHLWTQIVGKIRLALTPSINHWWHVPLYLTARGMTTSPIPYPGGRAGSFEMSFDLIDHNFQIMTSDGSGKTLPLIPRSVASFYQECMTSLNALGIDVTINTNPCEVKDPIPLDEDETHCSYDPVYANRFWRILMQTEKILRQYRSPFLGKSSPIHFFWGSFDLALSFFCGKPAPQPPDVDPITREGYSYEVISCGFWPGDPRYPAPAFYAYTAPEPAGYEKLTLSPATAFYHPTLKQFILPYEDVLQEIDPAQAVFLFFKSAYEGGAELANWDRKALEKQI